MKKLLGILSSLAIVTTGATTVVSCSVTKTDITVRFSDDSKNTIKWDQTTGKYTIKDPNANNSDKEEDVEYTPAELDAAMQGNGAVWAQALGLPNVAMSFDQLNISLLNLISFNQSLVVKTQKNLQQLKDFRDTFLGRDSNQVNPDKGIDTPSVDGIKFNKIDTDLYYNGFNATQINSLTGLYDLYNANKNGQLNGITPAIQKSLAQANKLFANNKEATDLMSHFANSKENPAFTDIKYDMPLTVYHTQSQLLDAYDTGLGIGAYAENGLHVGDVTSFANNNVDVAMEKEGQATNTKGKKKDTTPVTDKITDHGNTDPMSAIVALPSGQDAASKLQIAPDIHTAKEETKASQGAADNSVMSEFFTTDDKVNDSIKFYSEGTTDKKANKTTYDLQQNIGEYLVKKVDPIKVTYDYQTNMEHNKDKTKPGSKGYEISFKLDNLAEVYSPIMQGVKGTTLKSIKKAGNTLTLQTSLDSKTTATKDNLSDLAIDGTKVDQSNIKYNDDGTVTINNVSNSNKNCKLTFKNTKDGRTSQPFTYTFDASKDGTSNYTTTQLSWLFRGYKFLDPDNLTSDETSVGKFVNIQTDKNGPQGGPMRSDSLAADITHDLRDMQSTDWDITALTK